mgnify:CR=1 FL=1
MIQIYYNGKLLGQMNKYDSRSLLHYWDRQSSNEDVWLGLQSKYQKQYGIDDNLDFVEPRYEEA